MWQECVIVIDLLRVKLFNRTYLYWRPGIQLGFDCYEFDCWISARSAKVGAEFDQFGEVSIGRSTTTEASLIVAGFLVRLYASTKFQEAASLLYRRLVQCVLDRDASKQ